MTVPLLCNNITTQCSSRHTAHHDGIDTADPYIHMIDIRLVIYSYTNSIYCVCSSHIIILIYINKYHKSTPLYATYTTSLDTSVDCMPTHNHKLCESIDIMPTTNIVVGIPDLYGGTSNIGAVAQWIRRLTSDQETVGSSPTGVRHFLY